MLSRADSSEILQAGSLNAPLLVLRTSSGDRLGCTYYSHTASRVSLDSEAATSNSEIWVGFYSTIYSKL